MLELDEYDLRKTLVMRNSLYGLSVGVIGRWCDFVFRKMGYYGAYYGIYPIIKEEFLKCLKYPNRERDIGKAKC